MKKILLITLSSFAFLCADEFIESSSSFGGYGELHYDMEKNDGDGSLDFHRFIIYYKHQFNSKWSLMSEVELEHNMVGSESALGYEGGYVALEQAFLNYWNGDWGFKGGVVLVPAGITNEYHEPPTFMSVERPEYNKYIIPTTWFDNGFSFYGTMGDLNWNYTMVGDLNGDDISEGIRSGRMKGFKSSTTDWTKTLQASWTGMEGLKVGGSITMNDAPTSSVDAVDPSWVYTTTVTDPTCTAGVFATQAECEGATWNDDSDDGTPEVAGQWTDFDETTTATWDAGSDAVAASTIGVALMEVNATYSKNNMYARLEYGTVDYTDNQDDDGNDINSSSGYYLDLGYNIADMINCDADLYLWTRMSSYSKDDDDEHYDNDISLMGVTYKPVDNIAIKFEMGSKDYWKKSSGVWAEKSDDVMRLGLGYMF